MFEHKKEPSNPTKQTKLPRKQNHKIFKKNTNLIVIQQTIYVFYTFIFSEIAKINQFKKIHTIIGYTARKSF